MRAASRSRPRVAIVGVGVLGGRLARELVSSRPDLGVALHAASAKRRHALVEAFGSDALVRSAEDPVDPSVEVVVLAGEQRRQVELAAEHLDAGRHVVATADGSDHLRALLELDGRAVAAGRTAVLGAAFSPGLSSLLARLAADSMDVVEEAHFARHGAGGPLCAADRHRALRRAVREWRDGIWVDRRPGSGRELCWFPDPIGGADAYRAATGEPELAVDSFEGLQRSSARMVLSRWDRVARRLPVLYPAPGEGGIGAIRVEVRGRSGRARVTKVLGSLDRPAVAGAAVAAEVALDLLEGRGPGGAHGLSSWSNAGDLLGRLRGRGVRVAELSAT